MCAVSPPGIGTRKPRRRQWTDGCAPEVARPKVRYEGDDVGEQDGDGPTALPMAEVMAEMPGVWRRLLAAHVPDRFGRCSACRTADRLGGEVAVQPAPDRDAGAAGARAEPGPGDRHRPRGADPRSVGRVIAPSLARAAGLFLGVAADAVVGDPRRGHPVAGFGALAAALERRGYADRRGAGVRHVALLVGGAVALGVGRRAGRRRVRGADGGDGGGDVGRAGRDVARPGGRGAGRRARPRRPRGGAGAAAGAVRTRPVDARRGRSRPRRHRVDGGEHLRRRGRPAALGRGGRRARPARLPGGEHAGRDGRAPVAPLRAGSAGPPPAWTTWRTWCRRGSARC